jgi:hypothetical protein
VYKGDPLPRQVGKSSEVLGRRDPLRLEESHLTRRTRAVRRFAADNPAHRRIVAQALGVHILVSGKATEYRAETTRPRRVDHSCHCVRRPEHHAPSRSNRVRRRVRDMPAIQHRRSRGKPRNWSIKRRSKSSRTASDPDSPLGCAMAASLDPGKMLVAISIAQAAPKLSALSGECGVIAGLIFCDSRSTPSPVQAPAVFIGPYVSCELRSA